MSTFGPTQELDMRKWYMPLTLLGIGGLGLLFLTERGRRGLRWAARNMHRAPDTLLDWNEAAQRELDRIQNALEHVADSLGATR
jgi:hypothetical protein